MSSKSAPPSLLSSVPPVSLAADAKQAVGSSKIASFINTARDLTSKSMTIRDTVQQMRRAIEEGRTEYQKLIGETQELQQQVEQLEYALANPPPSAEDQAMPQRHADHARVIELEKLVQELQDQLARTELIATEAKKQLADKEAQLSDYTNQMDIDTKSNDQKIIDLQAQLDKQTEAAAETQREYSERIERIERDSSLLEQANKNTIEEKTREIEELTAKLAEMSAAPAAASETKPALKRKMSGKEKAEKSGDMYFPPEIANSAIQHVHKTMKDTAAPGNSKPSTKPKKQKSNGKQPKEASGGDKQNSDAHDIKA